MRDSTKYIVAHCSATQPHADIGADDIDEWHRAPPRNWRAIGYHYVIRQDGRIESGRPVDEQGAHAYGHNHESVGVCLVGGIDRNGKAAMTFSVDQLASLRTIVDFLRAMYPDAQVLGHRDLSPDRDGDGRIERGEWLKDCPCLDVGHFLRTSEAVFDGSPSS